MKNLLGKRFGMLLVVRLTPIRLNKQCVWECVCDCGSTVEVRAAGLTGFRTCSKACSQTTHGQTGTKLHEIWMSIINRTQNKNNKSYNDYGGRGIKLYRKWLDDFTLFRDYVTALPNCPSNVLSKGGPRLTLSLDRVDNDLGYEPGNLRWATRRTQNTNQRRTIMVRTRTHGTVTLKEASALVGIPYNVVTYRLRHGATPRVALTTPLNVTLFRS